MNSLTIAGNLLKRTLGNKKNIVIFILIPTLLISLIVSLLNADSDQDKAEVDVLVMDQGPLATYIVDAIRANPGFIVVNSSGQDDMRKRLVDQKTEAGIVIPSDFSDVVLSSGKSTIEQFQLSINERTVALQRVIEKQIQMLQLSVGTVERVTGTKFAGSESEDTQQFTKLEQLMKQQSLHQVKGVVGDQRRYTSLTFGVTIGFTLAFIMGLVNSSISTVIDDRRNQTMMRTFAAPVRASQIALGNFIGSAAVGTAQIAAILFVSQVVLRLDFGLPVWKTFIVLECFMFAALGIATAVAGLIRGEEQVSIANALVLTPTCMLGGCFWPITFMPDFMQRIANFVPQKWAIEAIMDMANGSALSDVAMPIMILAAFAVVLLGFGAIVLKPSENGA